MSCLGIFGYGKMGSAIHVAAEKFSEIKRIKIFQEDEGFDEFLAKSDYILDFSSRNGTEKLLNFIIKYPKPVLVGTTSLSEKLLEQIKELSKKVPVIHASNVSLGANLQAIIASKLARILGDEYEADIIDFHHKQKIDSPSGTAFMIAEHINDGYEKAGKKTHKIITDRVNNPIRGKNEIAICSIRSGNITGEHRVTFSGEYDSISINHKIEDRKLLALGAIKTIIWLKDQKKGLYKMADMLKL